MWGRGCDSRVIFDHDTVEPRGEENIKIMPRGKLGKPKRGGFVNRSCTGGRGEKGGKKGMAIDCRA